MADRTLNTDPNRLEGPSPALEVAVDMVRRGVVLLPVAIFACALFAGFPGAVAGAYGVLIVFVNFLLAAFLLGWASQISFAVVAAAALGGYTLRLGIIFLAVWLVKDVSWVALVPLAVTIVVTHLGLLVWELRHVSASMAYPGLHPKQPKH